MALLAAIWLGGCATQPDHHDETARRVLEALTGAGASEAAPSAAGPDERDARADGDRPSRRSPIVSTGDGGLIERGAIRAEPAAPALDEDVALNFENADIREVARVVLGDYLNENYVIDPRATGQITLRSSRPLGREELLAMLETALEVNGAALVHADGLYRIVPAAGAPQAGRSLSLGGRPLAPGFQTRIVELDFVPAEEIAELLRPLFTSQAAVQTDRARNLLILSGSSSELAQADQLVDLFDVDVFSGMSMALFPVRYVDASTLASELRTVLSAEEGGAIGDVLRLMPVERLNALLVVSPQRRYLDVAETWLERLDVPGEGGGRRLFVYRVENVRAADLAGTLQQLFLAGQPVDTTDAAELAPGATPRVIRTSPGQTDADLEGAVEAVDVLEGVAPGGAESSTAPAGEGALPQGEVSIIADANTNSLAILAHPNDYAGIESAIRQLDVMPLQVLLETSIIEVTLSGALSYGMQWFFDNVITEGRTRGFGNVGLPLSFPGSFSYSVVNAADELRAVFRVLASEDRVQVVSSPSVVVLDNRTANIRVGNQQPISTAIVTEDGIVATSVQFKDTGVTLNVTPRVNAGGLVTLEISQELTDVGQIDDATGQRAFLQRSIESSVALESGESIVLGGLIRDNESRSESGVPFLHKVPVVGPLFGQKINTQDRTELLIFINVTVIRNAREARAIVDEFRERMPEVFSMPMKEAAGRQGVREPAWAPAPKEGEAPGAEEANE